MSIHAPNLVVYKIPYRRARAWPSGRVRRASKGILHTTNLVQLVNIRLRWDVFGQAKRVRYARRV